MPTSDTVTVPWTRLGTTDMMTTPESWPSSDIHFKWDAPPSGRQPSPVPAFCLGPGNEPWIAFVEPAYNTSLVKTAFGPYVWKYTGGSWVKVSGPASDGALSPNEVTSVYTPFYTGGGDLEIDGTPGRTAYDLNELQMVYDGSSVFLTSREAVIGPVRTGHTENLANYLRTVWIYDGSWTRTELPNLGASLHWIQQRASALRTKGSTVAIAWVEHEIANTSTDITTILHRRLYCAYWNGSGWSVYGGGPALTDWTNSWVDVGDMVLDKNGYPHIILGTTPVLTNPSPNKPIRIFSWTGSTWVETQLDYTDLGLNTADYSFGSQVQIRIPGGGSSIGVGGSVFSEAHGSTSDLHQAVIDVRRISNTNDPSDPATVNLHNFVFEWNAATRTAQKFKGTTYLGESIGNAVTRMLQPEDSRNLSWFVDSNSLTPFNLIAYDDICQGWWIASDSSDLPSFGSYQAQPPIRMYRDGEDFYVVVPWYLTTPDSGINVYKTSICRNCFSCACQSIFWFYRDGIWRNSGVDTEYDLWVYHSGQWVRNNPCVAPQLQGRLDASWQT